MGNLGGKGAFLFLFFLPDKLSPKVAASHLLCDAFSILFLFEGKETRKCPR